MRFGATRHGPSAPNACQFGKYETFTRTGVPVRSTWNRTVPPSFWISVTVVLGSATACSEAVVAWLAETLRQPTGPSEESITSHRLGSAYQLVDTGSQLFWVCPTSFNTT